MGFLKKIEAVKWGGSIPRSALKRGVGQKPDTNKNWREIIDSSDLSKELKNQLNDFIAVFPTFIEQAKAFRSFVDEAVIKKLNAAIQENTKAKELGNKFLKEVLNQIKQETSMTIDI
jgi:hypothetical protein